MSKEALMAYISYFFLCLSLTTFTALAQQRQSNISTGASLIPTKNSSWLSPSGLYAFGFYPKYNGYAIGIFLAGIPEKTVVWTANRDGPPISGEDSLFFTSPEGLVLRGKSNSVIISASQIASSASISDSGNFVLYNSDNEIIWQSFEHPTDTLLQTQRLEAGSTLLSSVSQNDHSSGIFRLIMQRDGNLVQYPLAFSSPEDSYYASGTDGSGDNVTLNLGVDGRLYLLNSTGFSIMNLTAVEYSTRENIYLMRIDSDGIFRLYAYNLSNINNGNWSTLWESGYDKCNPKGICGINSYCVLNDQEPDCICLPGFGFVTQGNWTAGCQRSFTAERCEDGNSKNGTRMHEVSNTRWDDDPFSIISLPMKSDCERACLEDCNCDAAFFKDSQCKKQRLPLRYGRRDRTESNSAFIKIPKSMTTSISVHEKEKKGVGKSMLIVSVSIIAFGFVILAILGIVLYRYHLWAYKRISNTEHIGLSMEITPRPFTYLDVEKMTHNFKEEIGRGSFGVVYKGAITNKGIETPVAVKKLEGVLEQGEREFQNEVRVIGKTHHKNLVHLLGYCNEGSNRILVYEYMPNKSLHHVLFSSSSENKPCFAERVEIARNIAKGILYLHEECEAHIIHCDLKPANILMDEFRNPKIADFGLAKLLKPDQTKTFTGMRGTRGYVAPEWHKKLPVTVKADVYSFGIVLLEIACCRRNVDQSLPENECILVDWVYDCYEAGEIEKLVSGDEEVDIKQMERMVKIALWCSLDEPSLRPSMKKVLLMLEGTVDIPIPPSPTSFLTCI